MLTQKKVDKFCRNYFSYFFFPGLVARNIWCIPVLDAIVKVIGSAFIFLMFLMLYLSWRETHSFRQVFKQNWVNIVTFILPITILLLYVIYRKYQL